jgi:alpha-glucosidase (family GH31 glycosyl hydrolase)
MLKHIPVGIGHPYRTEPFERTPHFPEIDSSVVIRVCTEQEVKEVLLHINEDGVIRTLKLSNEGNAVAQDLGEYGKPDKEIFSNTHLEDAAVRSGEYSDWDSWSGVIKIGSTPLTYYFSKDNEDSEKFEVVPSQWRRLHHVTSEIEVEDEEWLVGPSGAASRVRFKIPIESKMHVIGFGERFHSIVQNGELVDAVVYEEYKGQGHRTYLPTPFAVVIGGNFGFHLQTTRNARFDLSCIHKGFIEVDVEWSDYPAKLNLQRYDGTPAEVLHQYLAEVGMPDAPPEWIYSLWLSSNEWNTQERVEQELAAAQNMGIQDGVVVIEAWSDESTFTVFRDAQYAPTQGKIGLKASDISYPKDGAWPDPSSMITKLHDDGFKLILWQIPVIKERGESGSQARVNWDYAIANDHVVKDEQGNPYHVRGFWFRDGLLPDLTNAESRRWWTEQRRYLVEDLGVDGFKTDGGEHAWGSHLQYKDGALGIDNNNLFAKCYAQAFHELFHSLNRKPVTFSRAGFTGSQKYPSFWAGDENSTWKAFKASINAGITASASGFFFWGWDIGGFSGEIPSPELYLRSTAMSVFTPIMQIHSEFNHHQRPSNDRTPWNIAERFNDPTIAETFSSLYQLRRKLIPYLAREGESAISTGRPLMAGLFFDYPNDAEIWKAQHQFMCGRSILVAPITEPNQYSQNVYLPKGRWIDFWSGESHEGGQWISVDSPLHQIPVFTKEGSTIY